VTAYIELPNLTVTGKNGATYTYRDTGGEGRRLLLLQHFRGNLDNWDPALIDSLSADRRVVTFNNEGVASSTGVTPATMSEMARGALTFVDALDLDDIDILGYSIGSFIAQEILLMRPDLVHRAVLASSAPQGAQGMFGWAADVIAAVGAQETSPQEYLDVFFAKTDSSRLAGQAALGRIYGPHKNPDEPTDWATRLAQYDAVCAWGTPNHALLQRVTAIQTPVFIANGDSDPMILPRYSYLLAGLIPNAQIEIYPDSAHGFLWQHHEQFASDVHTFLNAT
jgi:pimeloyl-ACP methyl ester carboxylesterase